LIRNATPPVFHKGNSFQKEKEKRTKKEKENLWKMPHPWKSASLIGGLRRHFLDADSHRCLEKPRSTLGFPTFPTGPTTIHNITIQKSFLKNYKGGLLTGHAERLAAGPALTPIFPRAIFLLYNSTP
jgi:hypothetical protein